MGKSSVNETYSNFHGVYAGDGSHPAIREFVEASDLVLTIGSVKSDFNTTGFTYRLSKLQTIDLHSDFIQIDYARYDQLHMKWVLSSLTSNLDPSKLHGIEFKPTDAGAHAIDLPPYFDRKYASTNITHDYLWPRLSAWLEPKDVLLTETGTSYLG